MGKFSRSRYAVQNGPTDHTYYTQLNMTRTIDPINVGRG
jgi:hypothetical protein